MKMCAKTVGCIVVALLWGRQAFCSSLKTLHDAFPDTGVELITGKVEVRDTDGTTTSLYRILDMLAQKAKTKLHEFEKMSGDHASAIEMLVSRLVLIEKAQELLISLDTELKHNQRALRANIDYRFKKICDNFKNQYQVVSPDGVPVIRPRDIRACNEMVKQFNDHVVMYSIKHKDVLAPNDVDMFNKISMFNQILLYSILTNACFETQKVDEVIDQIIYLPYEAVCKHIFLTMAVTTVLFAALVYTLATKNTE